MARSMFSIIWFASTLACATLIIIAGAVFTVEKVADAVAAAPVKSTLRPSYIARFPRVEATDLDIAKSVKVAPAVKPASTPAPAVTHEVAVDTLVMRAQPTKRSTRLASLPRGAKLSLLSRRGNWALVSGPKGQGWVYVEYLRSAAAGQHASR